MMDSVAFPQLISAHPSAARYLLSSSRPIPLTQALLLSEKVHKALVEHSGGSATFTGCDSRRRPLKGHGHAYIFCESNPGQGRCSGGEITHVTVYSRSGFGPEDVAALQRLSRIYGGDIPDVSLSLMALGRAESPGQAGLAQCPLLASSRRWVSKLPFLPARHPKFTRAGRPRCDASGLQIDGPEHELRRLLRLAGFPEPVAVEPVAGTELCGRGAAPPNWAEWSSFVRIRNDPESAWRDSRCKGSFGFRILFPEQVEGPLALGYAAHLGMGSFVPE